MLYISYCTEGVYEQVMKDYLLPTLIKWKLDYKIDTLPNYKDWTINVGMKSEYILKKLLEYKQDICFIDADATIEQYPYIFDEIPKEYDIAVHYLDFYNFWHDAAPSEVNNHLISAVLMVRYNERTIKLLEKWSIEVKKKINILEQKVLQNLIFEDKDIKVFKLPIEYCAIIKRDGTCPVKEPVIHQHQISRKYRYKQ